MDNSLAELENELKALQPRRANPAWLNQINRELAAELPVSPQPGYRSATNLNSWKWLGWRTAGFAAAIVLATTTTVGLVSFRKLLSPATTSGHFTAPASPLAAAAYEPVNATNVLYDLKDEGEVRTDGAAPAHQVRARYVDTYTWKNPRTNASIRWTVPRDEIRVVPVSYSPN